MYNINLTVVNDVLDVFEIVFIGGAIYLLGRILNSKLDFLGLIARFTGLIKELFKAKR